MNPDHIFKSIIKTSKETKEAHKHQLCKPVESYVFTTIDQVNGFLKELFANEH